MLFTLDQRMHFNPASGVVARLLVTRWPQAKYNGHNTTGLEGEKFMSITAAPPGARSPRLLRRFSVQDYHRLIEDGYFAADERYELLEGLIIHKMVRNPAHDVTLDKSQETLRNVLPSGWRLRSPLAITLEDSEPEPDLAIVQGTVERYATRHPQPADIAWLGEVAASSLYEDRNEKGRIYARARVPVYWIINVEQRLVEVYTDPTGPTDDPHYRQCRKYGLNEQVPLILNGQEVTQLAVGDLLVA